jgi:hypothetical protein
VWVGFNDLGPALAIVLIALYGLYQFSKRRAGGAQASHQDQWRAEFGFEPGEELTHAWFGVLYVGPLRTDVSYSTLRVNPRILAIGSAQPVGMPESTGRTCRVALSDRGRLAVSIEVSEDSDAADQLRALAAQGSGMLPLQQFGPHPRPEVQSAERAFSKQSNWRAAVGEAPRMRGATGALVTYELVHIVGPELPRGVTAWLDPDGVKHLRSWSRGALAAAPSAS